MKRITVEPRPVVYEIACDRCGKEGQRDSTEFAQLTSIRLDAGYGSIFGDGNRVEIDLCEPCLRDALGPWLRVTSPGNTSLMLARFLDKFEPEKHGGEFPTAADARIVAHEGLSAGRGNDGDTSADVPIKGDSSEIVEASDGVGPRIPATLGFVGSQSAPTAPEGFASWLDFAVETFDTRAPWLDRLFSEDDSPVDRDAIREAA